MAHHSNVNIQVPEFKNAAAVAECGIANLRIDPSGAEIVAAFGGEKETHGGRWRLSPDLLAAYAEPKGETNLALNLNSAAASLKATRRPPGSETRT